MQTTEEIEKTLYKDCWISQTEVTSKAYMLFLALKIHTKENLEDYWFQISPNWNVNIWQDEGEQIVTVYSTDMITNKIDTQKPIRIWKEKLALDI